MIITCLTCHKTIKILDVPVEVPSKLGCAFCQSPSIMIRLNSSDKTIMDSCQTEMTYGQYLNGYYRNSGTELLTRETLVDAFLGQQIQDFGIEFRENSNPIIKFLATDTHRIHLAASPLGATIYKMEKLC